RSGCTAKASGSSSSRHLLQEPPKHEPCRLQLGPGARCWAPSTAGGRTAVVTRGAAVSATETCCSGLKHERPALALSSRWWRVHKGCLHRCVTEEERARCPPAACRRCCFRPSPPAPPTASPRIRPTWPRPKPLI